MESTIALKLWAALKWILPAALGSAIAVFLGDKTHPVKGFSMFVAGSCVAGIFGGGIIEYFAIKPGMLQASIYLAVGLWGMGVIIQVYKQIPMALENLREKFTK